MWKFICISALAFVLCAHTTNAGTSADAETLPDKPQPQPQPQPQSEVLHRIAYPFVSTERLVRDTATFKDPKASTLALIETGFLVSDGITTRQNVLRGAVEIDPLARLFIGRRPGWPRMIVAGTAVGFGSYFLAEKMHRSPNKFVRRIWWVPHVAAISGNVFGTVYNLKNR